MTRLTSSQRGEHKEDHETINTNGPMNALWGTPEGAVADDKRLGEDLDVVGLRLQFTAKWKVVYGVKRPWNSR